MEDDSIFVMNEDFLDTFQRRKKKRLVSLKAMLKKLQKTDLKTFAPKVSVENGIHAKTLRGDLSLLEDAGYIKISDGQISWIEDTKPKKKKQPR